MTERLIYNDIRKNKPPKQITKQTQCMGEQFTWQ